MQEATMVKLYEKFNLSTRKGTGGMTFKYVPNEDVINRMNEVFKGNWSTFIKFRDIVDDQVILEVEVKVVDSETQMAHSHTGFGSQQIMRYNSGPNQGKIIDIGNGYKGALAKAIVNACTRWGVGLYKEDDPVQAEMPMMPVAAPAPQAVAPPVPNPAPPPVPNPVPVPPVPVPVPPAPVVIAPPVAPVALVAAVPTTPMPIPPSVAPPLVVENTTTFVPPMHPEQPVSAAISITQEVPIPPTMGMPKIPAPDAGTSQAPPASTGLNSVTISDVQKVALNGILSMNNANYEELAAEAFQANSIANIVPPRENLSYEEAVVVIKFGNEKYRKNR